MVQHQMDCHLSQQNDSADKIEATEICDKTSLGEADRITSSWTDSYFDDKIKPSDLITVFDYDRKSKLRCVNRVFGTIAIVSAFYFLLMGWLVAPNIGDNALVNATVRFVLPMFLFEGCLSCLYVSSLRQVNGDDHPHVALTRKGIRIDHKSSNSGYRTVCLQLNYIGCFLHV